MVRLDGQRAGTLVEEDGSSRVTFAYDAAYVSMPGAVPVSLSLPLGQGPWTTQGIHPFFSGLLPEGWLRLLVVRDGKLDENDEMGILLLAGADCVGAVEILPEGPA